MQNTKLDKNYKIILNETDLNEAIDHLNESQYVAFDTETTGLNVRHDKVIGFSFSGCEGVGYYLPIYQWNRKNNSLDIVSDSSLDEADILLDILATKKLIMHNASFDCRITASNFPKYDLLSALYCDTILLKHAVDEERPFRLKDIAKKIQDYIGLDVSKAANEEQIDMVESIKANGGSVTEGKYELYKADMFKIGVYACADTDLTIRIFNYYSKLLEKEGLESFFYRDETMPLLKEVTIPMESEGILLDLNLVNSVNAELEVDIRDLETQIHYLLTPFVTEFSHWYLNLHFPPKRSGEFAQTLIKLEDLPLEKTDSGRYSLSKSSLSQLASDNPYLAFLSGEGYLPPEKIREVQELMWENQDDEYMFNLSSKYHLKKLFFDILKEKPVNTTKKGNPQVDKLFLESVKDKYEFVPMLLDYNRLMKLKSSYVDRFLDKQEDGVFYPSFFQHRTISGRYGSDIQQLPRPIEPGQASEVVIKHTNQIRKFFISGDEHVFIDSDYESLEPHVFAHVSNDDGLKDIFRNNYDFYSTIAIATEGLEGVSADKKADNYLGKVDKPIRQKAKAYALGIPYGLESFKLSKELDISQRRADGLIKQYLQAYPKLAQWMHRSEEMCKNEGFVRSEAGRVRHMPKAPKIWFAHGSKILDSLELWKEYHEKPKTYAQKKFLRKEMRNYLNNSKNFQIQSLAASITNRACIAINRELKRLGINGRVCAQIHDQIIVKVPKKHGEKCRRIVQFLMENTYKISLKLKAPAEIAVNFYEGH